MKILQYSHGRSILTAAVKCEYNTVLPYAVPRDGSELLFSLKVTFLKLLSLFLGNFEYFVLKKYNKFNLKMY